MERNGRYQNILFVEMLLALRKPLTGVLGYGVGIGPSMGAARVRHARAIVYVYSVPSVQLFWFPPLIQASNIKLTVSRESQ